MGKLNDYILSLESGSREKGGAISEGIPSIGAEHLNNEGGFNLDKEKLKYISATHFKNMKTGKIRKGDILIVKDGATTGKISYVDELFPFESAAINEHIFLLRPNNNLFPKYLFYYLFSDIGQRHILSDFRGATVGGISRKFVNMPIFLPPLDIQQKIANILDISSAALEKRRVQIDKLDLLVKSQFIEMFGDPVTNPRGWEKEQLSAFITNANNGMARRGNDADGNIVLRLVELQDGFIDYSQPNRISLTEAEKKRYLLYENDFLFARVNGNPEYVGRCAVFHDIGECVYYNDHIIRVHFDESRLQGCFASSLLNSQYGKRQMKSKIKTSAGQYTISQEGIGAIEVIVPTLSLQIQFASFVQQVEAQKSLLQASLDKLELNHKSLMQKAFRGELF
ncbi:restriction endonuclease subunit S [Gudongella oleilytica]|uniref:restriction endonuclease subunit S n=1 Tax=Gudongella oleilytica TaxID=1582259 RepID=UPI002A368281|nr:restriction endonuclease subunit S [Gudongella oleilytica]MDY0256612.1 restriction endonuclease subunit S [Gudongella oleilytica]